jgi:hypothetical protein
MRTAQFGKKLADFQELQFMLADMAMNLEVARRLVYVAAAKSERGDKDLPFFGGAAKCFASGVAMQVTTDAVQLLGGYGYTRDSRRTNDAGREDHPDLRRHKPDPTRRHGAPTIDEEVTVTRTLSCPCGTQLVAESDDELVELAQAHLAEAHPGREYSRDEILFMAY